MRRSSTVPTSLLATAVLASVVRAKEGLEPGSPLPYLFQVPGNVAFAAVFALLAAAHFWLTYRSRVKWPLCLPIAEVFSTMGYVLRLVCRSNQQSISLYAVANLFVILAPAAFLAFNYMLYGRLIVAIDDDVTEHSKRTARSRFSLLPPRLFGRLFVWSDIITFLIQAAGGGLQATGGASSGLGDKIFLVGVVLQGLSYVLFISLVIHSHWRIGWSNNMPGVTRLLAALYFASICILVRSFFRVAEMAEGYNGKLYQTELYLFLLDSLPLVLANATWVLLWPPSYLLSFAASTSLPLRAYSPVTPEDKVSQDA